MGLVLLKIHAIHIFSSLLLIREKKYFAPEFPLASGIHFEPAFYEFQLPTTFEARGQFEKSASPTHCGYP